MKIIGLFTDRSGFYKFMEIPGTVPPMQYILPIMTAGINVVGQSPSSVTYSSKKFYLAEHPQEIRQKDQDPYILAKYKES